VGSGLQAAALGTLARANATAKTARGTTVIFRSRRPRFDFMVGFDGRAATEVYRA
jgi:hypothetical protein